MPMDTPIEIPLCEYQNELGRHRLYAVLDELTLTYRVLISYPDGRTRALRHHLPSRREARRWASTRSPQGATSRLQPGPSRRMTASEPLTPIAPASPSARGFVAPSHTILSACRSLAPNARELGRARRAQDDP
jgi:hypothetical protein